MKIKSNNQRKIKLVQILDTHCTVSKKIIARNGNYRNINKRYKNTIWVKFYQIIASDKMKVNKSTANIWSKFFKYCCSICVKTSLYPQISKFFFTSIVEIQFSSFNETKFFLSPESIFHHIFSIMLSYQGVKRTE